MDESHLRQMRSPFRQHTGSSSSLEGMEKPVRSFKSFIKSVPPNPSPLRNGNSEKPLPAKPTSTPPPTTPTTKEFLRSASVASWKAPAEWANAFHTKHTAPSPPIPSVRQYSPLLPEPTPDPLDRYMEIRSAQEEALEYQRSRLGPIMERSNTDLGPPQSPPKSPLPPPPPKSPARANVRPISPSSQSEKSSLNKREAGISPISPISIPRNMQPESPGPSTPGSQKSSRSSRDKAYAALGIGGSKEQSGTIMNDQYRYSEPSTPDSMSVAQERHTTRGKTLPRLSKGSPLADDGSDSEYSSMDEKMRQLSFSQDYHDMLVDQYHSRKIVSRKGTPKPVPEEAAVEPTSSTPPLKTSPGDQHLVPRPLSWRKSSSVDTSRSASQVRNGTFTVPEETEISTHDSEHKRKRFSDKASAWKPRRLSIGPANGHGQRESSDTNRSSSTKQKTKKYLHEDLRFSKFFQSKSMRHGRKTGSIPNMSNPEPQAASEAERPVFPPSPIVRIPGIGVSVIKTPQAPRPPPPPAHTPRSDITSIVEAYASFEHKQESGRASPSPASPDTKNSPEQRRESITVSSPRSPGAPPVPPRPPPSQNFWRNSGLSTDSGHSRNSSLSNPTQTPMSQAPIRSSKAKTAPRERRNSLSFDHAWMHPAGFFDKVREMRHKHDEDVRHEKLKRSIRVLGPTDPDVVAGYVRRNGRQATEPSPGGRMPGYMVTGPV